MDPAYRGLDEYLSQFDICPEPQNETVCFICIEADGSSCIRIVDMQFECDRDKQDYGEVLENCIDEYVKKLNKKGIIVEDWAFDADDAEDWRNYLKDEGYGGEIIVENIIIK